MSFKIAAQSLVFAAADKNKSAALVCYGTLLSALFFGVGFASRSHTPRCALKPCFCVRALTEFCLRYETTSLFSPKTPS